ncbi:winged helix-turn-helix transcriptional regulator [Bacteroides ilei]|uniref:winged helix-turn-helix transcriptional regulator n=1 Tax=Bacteroides ilei TaxID=1907658 RepID=UPI003AB71D19
MDKNKLSEDFYIKNCPIRNVLARICDKWSILIIFTLEQFPVMRFGELHRMIPDISQKMLTVTLRTLEEDGLVSRKVYAQIPPKVEYSLTSRGKSLLPHLNSLIQWAKEQMNDILQDRQNESADKNI